MLNGRPVTVCAVGLPYTVGNPVSQLVGRVFLQPPFQWGLGVSYLRRALPAGVLPGQMSSVSHHHIPRIIFFRWSSLWA